jgi:hypothetical protein
MHVRKVDGDYFVKTYAGMSVFVAVSVLDLAHCHVLKFQVRTILISKIKFFLQIGNQQLFPFSFILVQILLFCHSSKKKEIKLRQKNSARLS